LQLANGRWCLWRLADDEFVTLAHHSLPMRQNFDLLLRLNQRMLPDREPLTLAHILAVLESKFGPSSPLFDAHRGSLSFPLLVTLQRERRISLLLRCHDHRGMLHFPLYRVTTGDPGREQYQDPDPRDLSPANIDEFTMFFHSYLLELAGLREVRLVAPFYRSIPSELLLYGYDGKQFFERRYRYWSEFQQARQALQSNLGSRHARSTPARVEQFIDELTRE
jgi:hypothetical protein